MKPALKPFAIFLASSAFISLGGWGIYELATPRSICPGDAREKYEQVRADMTEAEIIALFGVEAGDHSTGSLRTPFCGTRLPRESYRECRPGEEFNRKSWSWDDGVVELEFDCAGKVVCKAFVPVWPPRSFFGQMHDWLNYW